MENTKVLFRELEYFLPYVDNSHFSTIYKLARATRYQDKIVNLSQLLPEDILFSILQKWHQEIETTETFIFFDSHYSSPVASYIKSRNPKCKIILYFWNKIEESQKHFFDERDIDEFWTFDVQDALDYSLHLNPQFYTKNITLQKRTAKIDVLFLGKEKDRRDYLKNIKAELDILDIPSEVIVAPNDKMVLSYEKYLKKLETTESILDITVQGQTGLTLRCMESIFLNKKLITNNKEVKKYDFYHPENIFIIGQDSMKDLKQFLLGESIPIESGILEEYDANTWVKRFSKP